MLLVDLLSVLDLSGCKIITTFFLYLFTIQMTTERQRPCNIEEGSGQNLSENIVYAIVAIEYR